VTTPVALRPITTADLPLVSRWLAQPHVAQWWRDPSDLPSVRQSYLPSINGEDPTEVFIIEVAGAAAGLIQRYLVEDDPEWDRAMAATSFSADTCPNPGCSAICSAVRS